METTNRQIVQHLQNTFDYLECEFLYLTKDLEAFPRANEPEADLPAAKLALAAFCVEHASHILQENDVVTFLVSRLGNPIELACVSVS
jgi:hypothetical protein